jgi:hypothetical protein
MVPVTAEQFRDVISEVGHVVWQIQVLEGVLGSYLVLVHKASAASARADVEAMFVKTGKQTLGTLLKAIRDTGGIAPLVPRLEKFVDERNWLVHRSRHEDRRALYSEAARVALIERITTLGNEALSLMTLFQQAIEDHLVARGMSKAEIDWRADQLRWEWTAQA